ncbi:SDR family oxidoreductase [Paratissierella segnis]|jgi:dTDP-4-dehydrorhamnose reductase|uniref:dTDP-4-dehydrorhamnose reductase n=1 Tax=Paratissierella segnis TaxID=2763679 RepID=A0A926IJS7_9FIRM|nr:SDR family oxidoreductase [Paratissierella segnis]MBC8588314.1 SDR family oxidoreductase [Paratissierella segnis]
MNKVLITGSNGMLGKALVEIFSKDRSFSLFGINRSASNKQFIDNYTCDLTDLKILRSILDEIKPDIIIHCAANVNLEYCEREKKYAYQLNAKSSEILASYNSDVTKFIYISTDSVFDGIVGDYTEGSETNPLNYYAFTKLEGEKLITQSNPNAIIIRTNIYGFHTETGNSLVEWGLKNLIAGRGITGFYDVIFNPVYTKQLAEVCYELIISNYKGLVNVGSYKNISKYDFLIKLADYFKLDSNLVKKGSIDNMMNFKVKRSKNTTLNTQYIKELVNVDLSIDTGFKELVKDYYNK